MPANRRMVVAFFSNFIYTVLRSILSSSKSIGVYFTAGICIHYYAFACECVHKILRICLNTMWCMFQVLFESSVHDVIVSSANFDRKEGQR